MQGLHLQNYASLFQQIPPVYQPTLKHFIVIRFWFLVTHRVFKSFNESDLKSCNVFFFTGLSNIIRKIVLEQLGYFMVLPNKITVPLSDKVDTKDLKCPDYAGVLRWDSTKIFYFCDIWTSSSKPQLSIYILKRRKIKTKKIVLKLSEVDLKIVAKTSKISFFLFLS